LIHGAQSHPSAAPTAAARSPHPVAHAPRPHPLRLRAGKVFSNATGFLPFNEAGYILPSAPLPSLTPYVKALRPAKPAPGGTMTVTLGVRNDGAADGKVQRAGEG
jgi:hypothetical protein